MISILFLSNCTFSPDYSGLCFCVSGNQLTITADSAPTDPVTITATKNNSHRRGIITWTDGHSGPDRMIQDLVTYTQFVTDPVVGYLNIIANYGSIKIVKTSEDGRVEGLVLPATTSIRLSGLTARVRFSWATSLPASTPSPSILRTVMNRRKAAP